MTSPSVTVLPEARRWSEALRGSVALDARARAFREQLGLPTDRPVVMSGHQAAIWHCGILAKWLACGHAASAHSATPAWVIVDHDPEEFGAIAVPVRTVGADGSSRVVRRVWRMTGPEVAASIAEGRGPGLMPPVAAADAPGSAAELERGRGEEAGTPGEFAVASTVPALRMLAAAMRGAAGASANAAEQLAAVVTSRTAAMMKPPRLFAATRVGETALMHELVERMRSRPAECVRAYNDAVAAGGGSGIAPLAVEAGRFELPVWRIGADGLRRRVWSSDGSELAGRLVPRALMLTALLRLAGCELFIHGTGGAGTGDAWGDHGNGGTGYDAVTERWIGAWLGERLKPVALVTATVVLPLTPPGESVPTGRDLHLAASALHRLRHDPAALGDSAAAAIKRDALAKIAAAGDRRARRAEFARMHAAVDAARETGAATLAAAERGLASLRARVIAGEAARDRTWPFVLHEQGVLDELSRLIRKGVSG